MVELLELKTTNYIVTHKIYKTTFPFGKWKRTVILIIEGRNFKTSSSKQVACNQISISTAKKDDYPVVSETSLDIFIFLVVPLYKSSRLQGNLFSIGAALREDAWFMDPPPLSLKEVNISSPKMLLENLGPPPIPPNGFEDPKNSA